MAVLAMLATGLAACGGDDQGETAARQTPTAEERAGAPNLGRFFMRKDEEPGFRPGARPDALPRSRETITGVDAFVKTDDLPAADARRLRREGFISITFQPIRGPRTAGVNSVALFETPAGAEQNLTHAARPPGRLENVRHFTVPGVPGATGWTASIPGEPPSHDVGNVFWVQGRCVLGLGNQGPGSFVGPLSKGVRAIYERTNGECP